MRARHCEKCGTEFTCGAGNTDKPCWCMEVPVSADSLKKLQEQYEDCLCPECLRALAAADGGQEP
ncbi:MAG: cysteine-rich CWC family protein [Candidatus Sumerlaeia bacterium]|nr:cysteine-rich CWC family protein [Candidatus Sumerlaeia bacterium]